MAKRWQKDADGILIFTGLFSVVLPALAAVCSRPRDRMQRYLEHSSASYLANIYHHLSHFRLRVKPGCPRSVDINTRVALRPTI
ncbi:hypothetical protein BGW80DRAFT_1303911 [Lactifluus volemus]|nr:hypothetical protein BGW80DRAFT_1303911 [Lactifluus volemus]